jgi:hypothetical protein
MNVSSRHHNREMKYRDCSGAQPYEVQKSIPRSGVAIQLEAAGMDETWVLCP